MITEILIGNFMARKVNEDTFLELPTGTVRDIGRVPLNDKDTLLYHKSWEWLYPVLIKIHKEHDCIIEQRMSNSFAGYVCVIIKELKGNRFGIDGVWETLRFRGQSPDPMEAAYEAVVDFIKWFNEFKRPKNDRP